jgi:hypothetical protein
MAAVGEPLPGESPKAYAGFCLYRDLGPRRSLEEASRLYHGSPPRDRTSTKAGRKPGASGLIRRWAQRWDWRARAAAWDREVERVKHRRQVEAIEEMAERHAKEALMLQNKAVERPRQLRPEELTPRETLAFLVEAAKLERLARGEPTERVAEEHHFPDVKELTDDELARIIAGRRGLPPAGGRGVAPPADSPDQPA